MKRVARSISSFIIPLVEKGKTWQLGISRFNQHRRPFWLLDGALIPGIRLIDAALSLVVINQ